MAPSWFTVVSFRKSSQAVLEDLLNLEIVTLDPSNPWLMILCKGIRLEKV